MSVFRALFARLQQILETFSLAFNNFPKDYKFAIVHVTFFEHFYLFITLFFNDFRSFSIVVGKF